MLRGTDWQSVLQGNVCNVWVNAPLLVRENRVKSAGKSLGSLLLRPSPRLSTWIFVGLAAGLGGGLFFGEYCSPLKVVGEAYVRLLQMTVLPYIAVSLIANMGRLRPQHGRRLMLLGGGVMAVLWLLGLLAVCVFPQCLPA